MTGGSDVEPTMIQAKEPQLGTSRPSRLPPFKAWWEALARRWAIGVLAFFVIGSAAVSQTMRTACLDAPIEQRASLPLMERRGMARLQLAGFPDRAQGVLSNWVAQCGSLEPAKRNLRWDYAFIFFYALGLAWAVALVARRTATTMWRLLGLTVILAAIVAGLADLIENTALWRMLGEFASAGTVDALWSRRAYVAASVKFALIGISIGYILTATVFGWRGRRNLQYRGWTFPQRHDAIPDAHKNLKGRPGDAATLDDVCTAEFEYIFRHRHVGKEARQEFRDGDKPLDESMALAQRSLVGIALSGGGIRSATTNLGVLQALARLGVLPFADYLCTVSGGGYIGAALSSLLSLNGKRVPSTPKPPGEVPSDPDVFEQGDRPYFGTAWAKFPFRDQREDLAEPSADLIAHLRTHGNFLIARRGVISRDTLRAIGNILSGIVFTLTAFLLSLTTATTLYLASVNQSVTGVDSLLGPERLPRVYHDPQAARPRAVEAPDTILTRRAALDCEPPSPNCRTELSAVMRPASGFRWAGRNIVRVATPVMAAVLADTPRRTHLRAVLGGSLIAGALSALFALGLTILAVRLSYVTELLSAPQPGEAQEEAFDKALLWVLTLITAGFVAVAFTGVQFDVPRRGVDELVALWIPLAVLVGARTTNFVLTLVQPLFPPIWNRRCRSLWSGYQAITVYGMSLFALFLLLAPLMYAFTGHRLEMSLGGAVSLIAARLLTPKRAAGSAGKFHLPTGLLHFLLGVAVLLTLLVGAIAIGAMIVKLVESAEVLWIVAAVGGVLFLLTGLFVDQNKLSPHYFYRDRLSETYLFSEMPDRDRRLWTMRDSMEMWLHRVHGEMPNPATPDDTRNTGPYHLISAAINLAGSRDLTRKDRKSDYWLFSKLYCGSTRTGFRPTFFYRKGTTKLASAVAISGAAASSGLGFKTFFAQAFATVLFNVRLGYWLENPARRRSERWAEKLVPWPIYIWREVTMNTNEHSRLVNLSDGGHTGDNIGIYPLLQRRCKVIIACDAEQDPALSFGSFTEALRHAYIDMGISVDIDLSMIRPDPVTGRSRNHCAVGRIRYPDRTDQASYLIYLKNSLTGDEPEPVLNYKVESPAFPHETTADQFFDDAQFESYRALGVHIAESTFSHWSSTVAFLFANHVHAPA